MYKEIHSTNMELKSVKRESIVNQKYSQMKEQIISSKWELGQKIPSENQLSQKFEVSGNTIRSAIQQLKAIGILKTVHGQGTFVQDSIDANLVDSFTPSMVLSRSDIIDSLEFRETIEMGCVELVAKRAVESDLEKISQSLDSMLVNLDDYQKFSVADYQFHLNIAKATKNKIFPMVIIRLKEVLYRHFLNMNKELGPEMSIENHKIIYEAIKNRNSDTARELMGKNIRISIGKLKSFLE